MTEDATFVICEKAETHMPIVRNLFVDYLNKYTTASPDHEAAFDEFIAQTPPPSGDPLRLQTKVENFLKIRFAEDRPPSVILTGNAGDGKTFLCRQIVRLLTNKPFDDWQELARTPLECKGLRLYVIKDLSELSEEEGQSILKRVGDALTPSSSERFLIAANEGRLRDLLTRIDKPKLKREIEDQLQYGMSPGSLELVVIDLTKVTTSEFVPETLSWMTNDVHWRVCNDCLIAHRCPISYNVHKLRDKWIVKRVQLLYEVLEHLDTHVTLRDMLIHLAFTVTGGQSCSQLQRLDAQRADLSHLVYYENILGGLEDSPFRRKANVVQHLDRLRLGEHSIFEIDDFIINGAEDDDQSTIHKQLFVQAVDLNFRGFEQERRAYLEGGEASERADSLLKWLPHCRRKLFFEWHDERRTNRLIPFRYLDTYHRLLTGEHPAPDSIARRLILGLNRAFARLYLTEDQSLYVTSQYLHSAEQPRPLVRLEIPANGVEIWADPREDEALNRRWHDLYLRITAPPELYLRRTGGALKPQQWRLNLLVFEYLLRLADGGTFDVLADECELSIRNLKDRLISAFTDEHASKRIRFFVAERQRYVLKTIEIDEQGVIRSRG